VNQEKITTKNAISVLDISGPIWKVIQEFELKYDTSNDGHYVGLEDIRLFTDSNNILYNANRGLPDGTMTVEHGKISLDGEDVQYSINPRFSTHQSLEKNWVLVPGYNIPKFIYHWNPEITVADLVVGNLSIAKKTPAPFFFRYLRGSTNAVVIKDEYWFICHAVSYEDRRYYYHIVVVLDTKFNLKRWTPFFTFEGEKVEYTLGFVYLEESDHLLIGYSVYDCSCKYIQVNREYFENQMIANV
jgi:hypothetical protein